MLADLTRQALELSGEDLVTLALPDEDGRRLTLEYAEGDGAAEARGLVVPAGHSLSGQVLARREVTDRVRGAVDAMDDTIRDIRATIFALQSRSRASVPRLRAEVVASRTRWQRSG